MVFRRTVPVLTSSQNMLWFADKGIWSILLQALLTEEENLLIINRLHQVLRPFMLRRLKHKVIFYSKRIAGNDFQQICNLIWVLCLSLLYPIGTSLPYNYNPRLNHVLNAVGIHNLKHRYLCWNFYCTGLLTFNESDPKLTLCFRENQGWEWTSRENRTTCALWSICIPEAAHEAGERENGIFWTCQGNLGIL